MIVATDTVAIIHNNIENNLAIDMSQWIQLVQLNN